jgi:hypothetical protein
VAFVIEFAGTVKNVMLAGNEEHLVGLQPVQ